MPKRLQGFGQNAPRTVGAALLICTIVWLSNVQAQDQGACGTRAETLLKQAFSLLQPAAGTGAESPAGLGRAFRQFSEKCVGENRCGPMELNMALFEASLDDAMVALQREKLARFKAVTGVRAGRGEVCAAVQKLEALLIDLKDINERQLNRLDQLAPTLFADPVGFLK